MELTQEHKNKIEQIIEQTHCPRDFQCYKDQFETLGKMRLAAGDELVECLDERAKECEFATPFGGVHYCTCAVRGYVARNFHI